MVLKSFPVVLLALMCSLTQSQAQEKLPVSISAALSYPISFGDNSLDFTNALIGWDVNAQFPLSANFSIGPPYRAGIYGTEITYTDENGNIAEEKFTSTLLNHLEVLSEYHFPVANKLNLGFGVAAGYSFMNNSEFYTYLPGKAPKGFDIAPGITLQIALSDHFALLTSAKYTFTYLNSTIDVGTTSLARNENIHEAAFAVGATYIF